MNIKNIHDFAPDEMKELPVAVSDDCGSKVVMKSFEVRWLNEETEELYTEEDKAEYIEYHRDEYSLQDLESEFRKVVYLS